MADLVRNFLGFRLDDVEYAVHVSLVKGVLRPSSVSEVPRMPLGVTGMAYLRNEVVPVVDLRTLLGLAAPGTPATSKWILVAGANASFVLVVDSVSGVFGASTADERPPPEMLMAHDVPKILFVTKRSDALVFALDVAAIASRLPAPPEPL